MFECIQARMHITRCIYIAIHTAIYIYTFVYTYTSTSTILCRDAYIDTLVYIQTYSQARAHIFTDIHVRMFLFSLLCGVSALLSIFLRA